MRTHRHQTQDKEIGEFRAKVGTLEDELAMSQREKRQLDQQLNRELAVSQREKRELDEQLYRQKVCLCFFVDLSGKTNRCGTGTARSKILTLISCDHSQHVSRTVLYCTTTY